MATRCGPIGTIVMRLPSGEELMALENPFVWHELVTSDQKSSGGFFARLFGWARREVDAGPFGTYTLFQVNGSDIAGMMNPTSDSPAGGSYWHTYFAVEDVDACAQRALQLGGRVLVAPHDVQDVGRICAVSDPTGAVAHLLQTIQSRA